MQSQTPPNRHRFVAGSPWWSPWGILALAVLAGCTQNPYYAAPGGAAWQLPATPPVNPADAQLAELRRRVQLLDDNNRQLHTQLAQSEQQSQVYRDELSLIRQQLADTTGKLESASIAAREAESRVQGFQASTQLRGNAQITPNTNLQQLASRLNLGGLPIEPDGNALRIVIPSDQLFQPGTAQLQPQAALVLDPIAAQLRSVFPRQRIAIEGYTDNAPMFGGQVATSHQLASAQAASVLELLTRRAGMSPQQLFTVAQGTNHPRATNETPAGRAVNRRIELVIYPETF